MKQYTLTITEQKKTYSMQSGKKVKIEDGAKYSYSGNSKKECLDQAKAKGRTGRKEWEVEEVE